MIIQAADKAGIPIPRFCYHDKLPIAANCRMCMVETEMGGKMVPKPQPACATPVMDGMKVFTRSQRALGAQRNVMEFLLINHPLDCPICDQGGECELQDVALGYGRSVSRFQERKRVVADEDLGPLVATDMTRCIQCTRCVRFTAEIAGTYELGGMNRGEHLEIGTYDGKPLMSELSGNVIDVCPVGALTNKVFRFRARAWELIARESIGYHDALGSNLFLHLRRGDVLRTVPRDNEAVNECWLSDKDRYSHQGLYAVDRASKPMVKDGNGQWQVSDAGRRAGTFAGEILKKRRGDALGVLVHPSTSNEEGALLAHLAAGLGSGNIDHRIGHRDFADSPVSESFGMSVADIEKADAIVLVGCNPRTEMPLLAQRIRKAVKRGAKVYSINPIDFDFAHPLADKRIVRPSQLAGAVQGIADGDDELADTLEEAKNVVVIVGEIAENHPARPRASAGRVAACTCRIRRKAQPDSAGRQRGRPRARRRAAGQRRTRCAGDARRAAQGLCDLRPRTRPRFRRRDRCTQGAGRGQGHRLQPFRLRIHARGRRCDPADRPVAGDRSHADQCGWHRPVDRCWRQAAGRRDRAGACCAHWAATWRWPVSTSPTWPACAPASSRKPHRCGFGMAAMPPAGGQGLERIATTPIYRSDAVLRRSPALQAHPLTHAPRVVLHPEDAAPACASGAMAKVAHRCERHRDPAGRNFARVVPSWRTRGSKLPMRQRRLRCRSR